MPQEHPNPANEQDSVADETPEQRRARGYKNLLPPIKPGEVRNPKGVNGHRRRQEIVAAILDEEDDDGPLEPGCSRIRSVVLAAVRDAKDGGPGAASAQKTCIEQYAGKARQQVELNGDALPGLLRVIFTSSEQSAGSGTVEMVGVEGSAQETPAESHDPKAEG